MDTYAVTHPGANDTTAPDNPFVFLDEQKIVNQIIEEFKAEETRVDGRREVRKHRVNVAQARTDPERPILEDETIIADRTVDRNVRQQSSPYLQFITQAPTILSFYDIAEPTANFEQFALYTSDIFRMGSWVKPWLLIIDSLQVHGGAWFELVYDPKLPQQAAIEYIRREDLIIPQRTRDINSCERFARKYEITKRTFKQLTAKYGFNPAIANEITEQYKHKDSFITIYKVFLRDDAGVIYNAWMADSAVNAQDWLRAPVKHRIGLFTATPDPLNPAVQTFGQVDVTEAPIFFIPLYAEEDETLLGIQGRAALDAPAQEAMTGVMSATVNGAIRASGFYPTRKGGTAGRSMEPLSNKAPAVFKHGHVVEGEFDLFQPQWPSAIALSVAQAVATRNSQDSGQVDFAAMSRQDTAKRATEISAAVKQAEELSSASMTLFADSIKPAYILWLKVLASAVLLRRINPPPALLPYFERVNSPSLNISMAAEVSVVRRAQRSAKYIQHYAIVAGTPFADPYYRTMLAELFPDEYPEWARIVGETDQYKQALAQALQLMQSTPANAVPDELRAQFAQFITAASAVLSQPNGTSIDGAAA